MTIRWFPLNGLFDGFGSIEIYLGASDFAGTLVTKTSCDIDKNCQNSLLGIAQDHWISCETLISRRVVAVVV